MKRKERWCTKKTLSFPLASETAQVSILFLSFVKSICGHGRGEKQRKVQKGRKIEKKRWERTGRFSGKWREQLVGRRRFKLCPSTVTFTSKIKTVCWLWLKTHNSFFNLIFTIIVFSGWRNYLLEFQQHLAKLQHLNFKNVWFPERNLKSLYFLINAGG